MTAALMVNQEQVILAGASANVDVLAQFDGTLAAEDRQPSVAPGREAVGGEPVDADVAAGRAVREHSPGLRGIGLPR